MRLDKCLASGGEWSRTEVKSMIRAGRIKVKGMASVKPESAVDPEQDEIFVDGKQFSFRENYCLMVYKPAGVVTATEDKRDRTVLSLLPQKYQKLGLFPAGRLDKDAEGFVLMTSDGELAHGLMSPRRHVDKVYYVRVEGELGQEDIKAFEDGITIDGGILCAPAEMEIISSGAESEARVTLREGRFHQLKRMFLARNRCVIYLKRESIGGVHLDASLEPSGFRELTNEEENVLRTACGLSKMQKNTQK